MVEAIHKDINVSDPLIAKKVEQAAVRAETKLSLRDLQNNIPKRFFDLREKGIRLGYQEINKEKTISINLPDPLSLEGRILRCMRRKPITDAAEKKYGIPQGLLLAMMAQEGMGDPTMPNISAWQTQNNQKIITKSDGGLGLIHIQEKNARNFGMDTLGGESNQDTMQNFVHGAALLNTYYQNGRNVKQLIKYDDRWHPILSIDCAARFLRSLYDSVDNIEGRRVKTLEAYSGRKMDYVGPVVKYMTVINTLTGDPIPGFCKKINETGNGVQNGGAEEIKRIKVAISKLDVSIDGKPSSYAEYLAYNKAQLENYGLSQYVSYAPRENTIDQIKNLHYMRNSKDDKWNIYEYRFSEEDAKQNLSKVSKGASVSPRGIALTTRGITDHVKLLNRLNKNFVATEQPDNFMKLANRFSGREVKVTDAYGNFFGSELPDKKLVTYTPGDPIYIRERRK